MREIIERVQVKAKVEVRVKVEGRARNYQSN